MPKEHLLSLNGNCNGNNGPVTCPECSKTFSKRDHLVRHQRTHTGDKPYACPVCGKSYARSDVARRHIAAHGSSFGGGSIRTASGSSSTGIPFPEGVPEPISGSPMFGMAGQQETETKPSVRGQSPAYTSPVSDQDSFNGDVNMLDHLSLDSSPSLPAPAGASSSSTSAAAPSTSAARVPQSSSLLQQEQHGPNEDAQLLANLSSNAASGANTSYAPYFPSFQSAHPQQQQHHQPPPPQPQQQQQQQPPPSDLVPSLDSVEWDQQLRDIFQGFNASTASSSAPFQVHNGDSLAPLADLSNTPLFDFSVLLSPEGTCHRLANMRPHTPPPAVSNEPPAERLMTIWPTRPSRRTRKTNTASVAQDQTDSHKLRQQQEQNGFDPHEVDPSTAQRMYAHLQGGGILFTKPLPTPEQLTDLLALYFEYVHPIWPMLHPPTFCPATSSSLLMLNMAALGAVFLRTPEGDSLAAAIMEKMHESLSFCMSAQLELYLDPADQDVLALTQAYMMRQLYWLTSGDRNQLEATQLFHSTVANVARRAGLFAPDAVEELEGDHEDAQNDEAQWRHWVAGEVRRRTALCFMLNDLTYAAFFMIPPYCSVGSIAWPLTTSDEVFEARTVEEWKHYRKLNASNPSVPLYTSAASLFGAKAEAVLKAHQKSGFSLHLLVGSITSVVLSTRVNRPNLENEMAMEPKAQMPVTAAMTSAYNLLTSMGDHDSRFYTVVMWHWCYMHLVCDIRMMELACGREGPEIAAKASKRAGPWAESSAARRAVLHCVSVLQVAKQTAAVGSEVPPHVYVALFQAWMIMRTYARFFPSACLPRNPRWGILGSYGASGDTGKPPNVNIPDAAATDWIRDGTQATPITGTKINRAMQDVLSTMRRIGYTKLRVMLSEVIEAIAQADSQGNPSGHYASPNFQ